MVFPFLQRMVHISIPGFCSDRGGDVGVDTSRFLNLGLAKFVSSKRSQCIPRLSSFVSKLRYVIDTAFESSFLARAIAQALYVALSVRLFVRPCSLSKFGAIIVIL